MKYDVAIIGSGASGGAVAYMLTQAGYKVAILEKGKYISREEFTKDEIAYTRRALVTPNLHEEYHTIEKKIEGKYTTYPSYQTKLDFWNGNIVGGSSNFMSGMFHRMHPNDFKLKSKYGQIDGSNIEDWVITYDELEYYYTLAEKLVGISGKVESHPFSAPRSTNNFPYAPTKENAIVSLIDASCHTLGITSLTTARAIISKDKDGRDACYYSNFCGSYGCSSGAKGDARESFLIPALKTKNLTILSQTHVTKLYADQSNLVQYVDTIHTQTMKKERIYATIFVLAAQAHESARLLLNSANKYHPLGLSNSSEQVGKNLIFSAGGSGEGELHSEDLEPLLFENLMKNGLFINRSILDWYYIDHWWDGKFKGGLVELMFEHQNIISRAAKKSLRHEKLVWGKELGQALVYQFAKSKTIRFEIFNDWLPTDNCFISLDPHYQDKYGMPVGKIRLNSHPHDLRVGEYLRKKSEMLLHEMGARNIHSSINDIPPTNLIAGGCRFGDNPKTSVLNKYCQSHEIKNLFVADASFMPTGGSVPYTWTIYANALRIGQYIVEKVL